jgi:hypothetical protein
LIHKHCLCPNTVDDSTLVSIETLDTLTFLVSHPFQPHNNMDTHRYTVKSREVLSFMVHAQAVELTEAHELFNELMTVAQLDAMPWESFAYSVRTSPSPPYYATSDSDPDYAMVSAILSRLNVDAYRAQRGFHEAMLHLSMMFRYVCKTTEINTLMSDQAQSVRLTLPDLVRSGQLNPIAANRVIGTYAYREVLGDVLSHDLPPAQTNQVFEVINAVLDTVEGDTHVPHLHTDELVALVQNADSEHMPPSLLAPMVTGDKSGMLKTFHTEHAYISMLKVHWKS